MRLRWDDLGAPRADTADGQVVELDGWGATATAEAVASYFLLSPEPACCAGCLPSDPLACVEVFATAPLPIAGPLKLRGRWRVLRDDDIGWRYQLRDAVAAPTAVVLSRYGWTRRRVLATAPLLCLSGPVAAQGSERESLAPAGRMPTVDIHSHAGSLLRVGYGEDAASFTPLAAPMREGGLAVTCLAIVSDSPTHRVTPEGRIRPFRDPEPGELAAYAERGFRRLHALVRAQGMSIIETAGDLRAATSDRPAAIVAAEGADFLEGKLDPLETAHAKAALRHLQLTHYRVNELGDIQTEAPVHGGLTAFGAEVIRHCQAMGIVVDVAHGTFDLVKGAVAVSKKPLILSHTSLVEGPRLRTRRISPDHARAIADTGGVIGIWPPAVFFPDLAALADGIAYAADIVGPAHVGLGTDMMGLVGASVLPSYSKLPELASALRVRFSDTETAGILGANYLRVFDLCLRV